MMKIADKDKDYVYVYSENPEEMRKVIVSKMFDVCLTTTYEKCPAIVVKKQKQK